MYQVCCRHRTEKHRLTHPTFAVHPNERTITKPNYRITLKMAVHAKKDDAPPGWNIRRDIDNYPRKNPYSLIYTYNLSYIL